MRLHYLDPLENKEKRGRLSETETRMLADVREAAGLKEAAIYGH